MNSTTRKFHRSGCLHSRSAIRPANRLNRARLDFWGAVALVCAIGMVAKFAQSLLTH